MRQPRENKVIYYSSLTDDFAGTNIRTKTVDSNFPYVHNGLLFRAATFLLYYFFALPLTWLYIRVVNGTKVVNRKALRRIKGGYFLYGNHTHWSDSFLPHVLAAPKRTYIIANPDAVSIKGLKNIVVMLGAIPVPSEIGYLRKFTEAIEVRCNQGRYVAVYPEAHIWPYYTGIRPFPGSSFKYPAKLNAPVVAMVTTFRKRKGLLRWIKTPARKVVFSDPIYAEPELSLHERQEYFFQQVYGFMKSQAEGTSQYEYVQYTRRML